MWFNELFVSYKNARIDITRHQHVDTYNLMRVFDNFYVQNSNWKHKIFSAEEHMIVPLKLLVSNLDIKILCKFSIFVVSKKRRGVCTPNRFYI